MPRAMQGKGVKMKKFWESIKKGVALVVLSQMLLAFLPITPVYAGEYSVRYCKINPGKGTYSIQDVSSSSLVPGGGHNKDGPQAGNIIPPGYYDSDGRNWDPAHWGIWVNNCGGTISNFVVTYYGNGEDGGNVPGDGNTYNSSSTVTVLGNTGLLTKSGYTFSGWAVTANGSGTVYSGGNTFIITTSTILYAKWIPVTNYSLIYGAGLNGSISGTSPQNVSQGGSGTAVTAIPNTGYHFVSWSDGLTTASRTDTNIQANINVTASFAINTYIITSSTGANGSISPLGAVTVNYGSNQTFTMTPSLGYYVNDVIIDSVSAGAITDYTFNSVTTSHTISVTFAINTYTITSSHGTGGSITGSMNVNYGADSGVFNISPEIGFHIAVVKINGVSIGTPSSYVFYGVTENHTINATFAINTYTLTYIAGSNGSISGVSPQTIEYGDDGSEVTAVPNTGYRFTSWSDGVLTASRTETNVQGSLIVTANFAINNYTLIYTAGSNGSITGTTPQTVNYGVDGSEVTAAPNTGYRFTSWSDGVLTASRTETNVQNGISVTANFEIDEYTITFDSNSGSDVGDITAPYGSQLNSPGNPTRTGFTFNGWLPEFPATMPLGGAHLVAQWIANPIVTPPTILTPPVPAPVPLTTLPAVLGAIAEAVVVAEEEVVAPEVKGSENEPVKESSDKTCPWWWIISLALAAVLAFVGGVIRASREDSFLRKIYYVWPVALSGIAWVAHYFLHKGFAATWFCDNYWLIAIFFAIVGGLSYRSLVKKSENNN